MSGGGGGYSFSVLKEGQQTYTLSIDVMLNFRLRRGGPKNLKTQGEVFQNTPSWSPPLAITDLQLIISIDFINYSIKSRKLNNL